MESAIKTNMKSIIFRAKWTGRVCAVGSMTPECIKSETADARKMIIFARSLSFALSVSLAVAQFLRVHFSSACNIISDEHHEF